VSCTAEWSPSSLLDKVGLLGVRVGVWNHLAYPENVPPLGERNAAAITAGHDAIEVIDEITRDLYALRNQLISELREDEDIRVPGSTRCSPRPAPGGRRAGEHRGRVYERSATASAGATRGAVADGDPPVERGVDCYQGRCADDSFQDAGVVTDDGVLNDIGPQTPPWSKLATRSVSCGSRDGVAVRRCSSPRYLPRSPADARPGWLQSGEDAGANHGAGRIPLSWRAAL